MMMMMKNIGRVFIPVMVLFQFFLFVTTNKNVLVEQTKTIQFEQFNNHFLSSQTMRNMMRVEDSSNNDNDSVNEESNNHNKKICVVVRTMYPFKHYTINAIRDIQDGLSNYSSKYELFVRVDETNEVGAIAALNSQLSTATKTTMNNNNWTSSNVSSINLSTILDSYPITRSYLYNESTNVNNQTGGCCQRKPMWQLLTPNDVHFVREHKDRCKHVWFVEDDVAVVGHMDDDGSEASISKIIMAKDDEVGDETKFVAIQVRNEDKPNMGKACPLWFHFDRHTHEFQHQFFPQKYKLSNSPSYFYLSNSTDIPWRCVSDGLRRISQDAAKALEESMVDHSMFAFAESFIHPIMLMNNISIDWWDAPVIKGLSSKKVTEETAREMLLSGSLPHLSNRTSWVMYQRKFI